MTEYLDLNIVNLSAKKKRILLIYDVELDFELLKNYLM